MVWELHEQGKTILLSSHNLAELSELCTDIGIIDAREDGALRQYG